MEINKITDEMRNQLRAPLPPEAVKPHPTKTYLSSIKAIYVTERLNDVFGIGAWTLKVEVVERADGGTVVVKDILEITEYGIYLESYGGNDNGGENSKNFDLGDAYKGASTDALTKICSYLEIGIDVFKGKSNPVGQPEQKAENNLPWLNPKTTQWTEAIKYLQTDGGSIAKIETKYKLSKVNKEKLIEEAQEIMA